MGSIQHRRIVPYQFHKAKDIGHFDVAINICGATSPIKSNFVIDEYLFNNVVQKNGSSIVHYVSLEHTCQPSSPSLYACSRSGHGAPADQCIDRNCDQIKFSPGNRSFYKGDAWFILKPDFVDYALYSPDTLAWQEYFKSGFVMADESYFQTVYYYSPFFDHKLTSDDILKRHARFTDWRQPCLSHKNSPPGGSPCYLGTKDFSQISRTTKLFARKFDWDELVLTWVDQLINDPRSPRSPISFEKEY